VPIAAPSSSALAPVLPGPPASSTHPQAAPLVAATVSDHAADAELRASMPWSEGRRHQFLAILGHELRNPLAAMSHGHELLEQHLDHDPAAQALLAMIARQIAHVSRLVDDLLDLTRIETGRIELRREPVLLADAVEQAVGMTRAQFEARRQVLIATGADAAIWLDADRARIVQVIGTVLGNAARYSAMGATTRVSYEAIEGRALVRVVDEGCGIAPELLGRIFDGFVQWRRGGGGLGIGLAVARMLVDHHGGTICARSDGIGRGATFELRLPLGAARGEGAADAPESTRACPRPLRVVLIEDCDDVRDATRALLERSGHQVATAHDGPSGLALILGTRPDVALVDMGLPGIDGFEVAIRVRAALGQSLRLIALTGFGQPHDRARAQAAGFDAHLTKPACRGQLLTALLG
jgi:CheY-like chemotaxis protein